MNIVILISKQALERLKKDRTVKENKKDYNREILMIQASGGDRPCELIGQFTVSPRGGKFIRVAWHFSYNKKTDTKIIYIDDLLYHRTQGDYTDNWGHKVRTGEINLASYSDYTTWVGF